MEGMMERTAEHTTEQAVEQYFEYGEQEMDYLRKKCKKLGAVIDHIGIIRRAINPDPFSALVESIVSQQISTKAAHTVRNRLVELCGGTLTSKALHTLTTEEIQSCGMSMRKAGYIKGIADAATGAGTTITTTTDPPSSTVGSGIDFNTLHTMPDQEIVKTLTTLKGVGVWTVEMLLIFSLARPDVVSYGDLAIRRGMMRLYGLKDEKDGKKKLTKDKFQRYAKRYSPYGSVASLYLWAMSDDSSEMLF